MVALAEKDAGVEQEEAFRQARALGTRSAGARNRRTDAEIDELVYDLYGITDEERKIIEGG